MYQESAFSASQVLRTIMIAFQWTSTGPQPIIYRANSLLSLVQHDGSYCQSTWDATHVSLLIMCFRKHWFLQKTNPLDSSPWIPSWSLSYWTLQYLIQECTSWLNSKKLLWELSHRSQLLILHWKRLIFLRFSISGIVIQLSTSYMCTTHSTMIAIVLPLTFL